MQSTNFISKIRCSTSNKPDCQKRIIQYDLNYTSLPWILVPIKRGKCCDHIFVLESQMQIVNVEFVLADIIWGDGKAHFDSIS